MKGRDSTPTMVQMNNGLSGNTSRATDPTGYCSVCIVENMLICLQALRLPYMIYLIKLV